MLFFFGETIMPLSSAGNTGKKHSAVKVFDFFLTGTMNIKEPIIDFLQFLNQQFPELGSEGRCNARIIRGS